MKRFKIIFIAIVIFMLVLIPQVDAQNVVKQDCAGLKTVQGAIGVVLCRIAFFLNALVPILITLAVIYFIWGVINYVLGSSEDAKKEGKNRIIWGLIGLAVITSVWGLVALLKSLTVGDNPAEATVPSFCIESAGVSCD